MKNHVSILFLCGIFFYNSCSNSNQNQNQETVIEQVDSGVLIASNSQNLLIDTPNAKLVVEDEELKTAPKVEIPKNTTITNGTIKTPISKNASEKSENPIKGTPKPQTSAEKPVTSQNNNEPKAKSEESAASQNNQNPPTSTSESKTSNSENSPFNHDKWDQLLRKHVSVAGIVNYKGLKADEAALESYLKDLEENPIQESWSKAKKMAYWINAYNAFTIKMIVDNYPVSSITKLYGGKPWDHKWIKLNGQTYNLNNIENDILRPKYKDARIHFAVNCAARSCPPILNQAWTEGNLNQMLEKQAKAFINNSTFNLIKKDAIEISKIFEWYAVDFGNIIDYLNKYSNTKINQNAKVNYKEYDWNLNE